MSCSRDIAWITLPAPRNRSALKNACVIRWKIAAENAPTPAASEHVPQLAHRRIRQHLLDVGLAQRPSSPRSSAVTAPTTATTASAPGRQPYSGAHPAHHVDPRRHHRRRVDQRRHRRRARHRVRQPHVQRDLRRLPARSDEEQQIPPGGQPHGAMLPTWRITRQHRMNSSVPKCANSTSTDPQDEPHVADPVHDERLRPASAQPSVLPSS